MQKINFSDLYWVNDDEIPVHLLIFETRHSYTVFYQILILSRQQTRNFKTVSKSEIAPGHSPKQGFQILA